MKKIGVLTLPLSSNNYGGIIQAYALQKKLIKLGADPVLLDRRQDKKIKALGVIFVYKMFNPNYLKAYENINIEFRNFIANHIKTSPVFFSHKHLSRYVKDLSIGTLITGSDQVWRTLYSKLVFRDLFLDFQGVHKFSYAASLGVDFWEDLKKKDIVRSLLKTFSGISVREESAVHVMQDVFNVKAVQHIDPTMLLTKEDYKNDLNLEEIQDIELLSYILDSKKDKEDFIDGFANHYRLVRTKVGIKHKLTRSNYKQFIKVKHDSIYTWLSSFMSAKFIITDSFHGVVFSILFNIPFIAIGNASRGLSRFNSILSLFKLNDRLITDYSETHYELYHKAIDFNQVNTILKNEREKSNMYLSNIVNI